MRKSNSEFITGFISNEGNVKKNRDYFAYVELEEMACWVLADGIDLDNNKLSAELVVGSIINDFSEKPSMDKKQIKKYIMNAHNCLIHESRIERLRASVVVIITDYKSIIYGNVGNSRIYNFKKNQIVLKSKDHTITQMMADIGKVDPKKINQHEERNNITQYLGMEGKIKIFINKKKITLSDGDVIFLSTAGLWENIKDIEIEDTLKGSNDPEEFLDKIEDCVLDKGNKNLDNYTGVSIFVNKVYKDMISKKKFPIKKMIASIIFIMLIMGSYFTFNKIQKIKATKIALEENKKAINLAKLAKEKAEELKKIEQLQKKNELNKLISDNENKEKTGDILYKSQEYAKSLEIYLDVKSTFENLKKEDKVELLNIKIKNIKIIIDGEKIEEQGDKFFTEGVYKKAESKYKEAKDKYILIKGYELKKLEEKTYQVDSILTAIDFEKEGDIYFFNENYIDSSVKYTKAKEKYKNVSKYNMEIINTKLEKSQILSEAYKIKINGDEEFAKQNYEKALIQYEKLVSTLEGTKFEKEFSIAKDKVKNVKMIMEAITLENEAIELKKLDDFEKSKEKYTKAYEIYKSSELVQKEKEIKNQISSLELLMIDKENKNKAIETEKEGDNLLLSGDFKNSKLKFNEAKNVFQNLKLFLNVARIDEKLKKVDFEEEFTKAIGYEEMGDTLFGKKEYDDAIYNFEMAKSIYSKLEKNKEYIIIDEKIAKSEKKKKRFILF